MGELRSYADVEPLDQEWLWRGYLPRAQVVILVGDSGVGKGYAWSDLVARVSRGDSMPDGFAPGIPPGHVLLISPEDDPSTSTVHRLRAARADLSKVHDITITGDGELWQANPDGYAALRAAITAAGGTPLVIIDPLGAVAVTGLTSEVPVRQKVMNPLQAIARETGATIVVVVHLTKAGAAARSRTAAKDGAGGSKGLTSAARTVLSVTRDRNDPRIRTLDVVKSNLDKDTSKPVRYTLAGEGNDTHVVWMAAVDDVAEESASHAGQDALLGMLLLADRPADGQSLAIACGIKYDTARMLLRRLVVSGLVAEGPRGMFRVATSPRAADNAGRPAGTTDGA